MNKDFCKVTARHGAGGRLVRRVAPLALALAFSSTARAEVEGAEQAGEGRIQIDVSAQVRGHCGISGNLTKQTEVARIDQSATLTFPFKINCNAPFAIGANSRHGGLLKIDGDADKAKGFATLKPYEVSLVVDTDADTMRSPKCTSVLLDANGSGAGCEFFGLTAGQGMSSGQRTAMDRDGTVTVHWNDGDSEVGHRLAAGRYQDVITIVVGVRS